MGPNLVSACCFYGRQSFAISIASDIEGVGDQVISCDDFVLPRSPYSSALHVEIGGMRGIRLHWVGLEKW